MMLQKFLINYILGVLLLYSFPIIANTAVFDYFSYQGMDGWYNNKINKGQEYYNPILSGFYPDPSICRKGEDYYLVNSSFGYFPGVPIFTSKDLVNWVQIGHVLDRPSQLNLDGLDISSGIFAPTIEYNKHNDTFYMITTNVCGIGNFLVKTKDPSKGWSDPILLSKIHGIDPSLFFDENGQGYIVHNDVPDGEPQWEGHRAIWIHKYDVRADTIMENSQVIINGGSNPLEKPIWIEGPHLYKKGGYYYLMAAEGGTSDGHSEVIFRSKNILGPYVANPKNPILTQRNLSPKRVEPITCVGHADMIETQNGEWWSVFLGCRPYHGNLFNTGRETFLLPVKWKKGFPEIQSPNKSIAKIVKKKNLNNIDNYLTNNFSFKDNFEETELDKRWNFIRTPRKTWHTIKNNKLIIEALPTNIYGKEQPAFIGQRQQHAFFEASTQVLFLPNSQQDIAGIVCFQNENFNFVLGKTQQGSQTVITLNKTDNGVSTLLSTIKIPAKYEKEPCYMRIEGRGLTYNFYVAFLKEQWITVAKDIDASILSTAKAGGFVGTYIGLYASSYANNTSLKELYKDDFDVGTAVCSSLFYNNAASVIRHHFNSLTAENAMKPSELLRDDGTFDWREADHILSFAKNEKMKIRGHTLVWHNQTPNWFFKDKNGEKLDSTQLYNRMKLYIDTVIHHFDSTVYCWDVVNEVISDTPGEIYRTNSPWFQICGVDYIEKAFRIAKAANPSIKLYYNDYNLTSSPKRERAYVMLKYLKGRGVPIDGVGMQAHWSMQDITAEDISKSIELFSSLGLDIQITELDLTIYTTYHGEGIKNQVKESCAFTPEVENQQVEKYKMIFDILKKYREKISSVTIWGISDKDSWLNNFPVKGRKDYPLLFDNDMRPKKSMLQIIRQ